MRFKQIFFVFFILLSFGCKSKKEFSYENSRVRYLGSNKVISQVIDKRLDYQNLFIKKFDGKVEFDDNKFSFKGAMYIEKDSQIVISVMPLMGIELFKAYISPTEIIVIDKTKKQVLIANIAYLRTKFNIDFSYKALESALSNQIEGFDQSCIEIFSCLKDYKFDHTKEAYIFQNFAERKLNRFEKDTKIRRDFYEFQFSNDSFRLSNIYLKDFELNSELKVTYSDFVQLADFVFPKIVTVNGQGHSKYFTFQMDISQIERNSTNEISFKIPEKFEKVYIK